MPGGPITRAPDDGILEFASRHQNRASHAWEVSKSWLRRLGGIAITLAIFFWMLKPVYRYWPEVHERVAQTDWRRVVLASFMFSVFLFAVRVVSWRRILAGLGCSIPLAPATRIWSTSELARYLPGVIWQVVGRVYLVRPYGVSGTICSTSQILELIIFLLANAIIAITCLAWFGYKHLHDKRKAGFFSCFPWRRSFSSCFTLEYFMACSMPCFASSPNQRLKSDCAPKRCSRCSHGRSWDCSGKAWPSGS